MFNFIKNLFKKEIKEIPGVDRVKINRVPIKRVEVKKFEPKTFESETYDPNRLCKVHFRDTGEIVVLPFEEALDNIFSNGRPVEIIGYVQ